MDEATARLIGQRVGLVGVEMLIVRAPDHPAQHDYNPGAALKDDLIARANAFVSGDGADAQASALVSELVEALQDHQKEAIRALWSVVKAQGGYARVPKLFVQAMGPADRLDVQIESSGEAVIYKALSGS